MSCSWLGVVDRPIQLIVCIQIQKTGRSARLGVGGWVLQPLSSDATLLASTAPAFILGGCWAALRYLSRLFFLPMKVDPPNDLPIFGRTELVIHNSFSLDESVRVGAHLGPTPPYEMERCHLMMIIHGHWMPIWFWQFPAIWLLPLKMY